MYVFIQSGLFEKLFWFYCFIVLYNLLILFCKALLCSFRNMFIFEHWPFSQSAKPLTKQWGFYCPSLWQGERQDSDVVEERNAQAQLEKAKVISSVFHQSFITQVAPNGTPSTCRLSTGGRILATSSSCCWTPRSEGAFSFWIFFMWCFLYFLCLGHSNFLLVLKE